MDIRVKLKNRFASLQEVRRLTAFKTRFWLLIENGVYFLPLDKYTSVRCGTIKYQGLLSEGWPAFNNEATYKYANYQRTKENPIQPRTFLWK